MMWLNKANNPYHGIDWGSVGRYRTCLHNHPAIGKGPWTPDEHIHQYKDNDYDILSLTEGDAFAGVDGLTWPWGEYSTQERETEPSLIDMIAIRGDELRRNHHFCHWFNDYFDGGAYVGHLTRLIDIAELGGLSAVAHAGRYDWDEPGNITKEFYSWLFSDVKLKKSLLGLEVANKRFRHPEDEDLWDYLLGIFMPFRNIWGFGASDLDAATDTGGSWNTLLMDTFVPGEETSPVKEIIEKGRFFFSTNPVWGNTSFDAPVITSVIVTDEGAEISGENYDTVEWISMGDVVSTNTTVSFEGLDKYVRCRLTKTSNNAKTWTQPIGLYNRKYRQEIAWK